MPIQIEYNQTETGGKDGVVATKEHMSQGFFTLLLRLQYVWQIDDLFAAAQQVDIAVAVSNNHEIFIGPGFHQGDADIAETIQCGESSDFTICLVDGKQAVFAGCENLSAGFCQVETIAVRHVDAPATKRNIAVLLGIHVVSGSGHPTGSAGNELR